MANKFSISDYVSKQLNQDTYGEKFVGSDVWFISSR